MKKNYLFPHSLKKIGCLLLLPATTLGIMVVFFDFEFDFLNCKVLALYDSGLEFYQPSKSSFFTIIKNNLTNEIAGILFIVASMLAAFSKEKKEDEYISKIRLDSLLWSTHASYIIMLLCFIFLYNMEFFYAMVVGVFLIPIVFIIRFNCVLFKSKRCSNDQ